MSGHSNPNSWTFNGTVEALGLVSIIGCVGIVVMGFIFNWF